MHPFEQTVSVIGPIVGGIIALTLFFKLLGRVSRASSPSPSRVAFKGILDERTPCTVHVGGGTTYENVLLIGFTDSSSPDKGPFPYELSNMVILEHADGRRTLVLVQIGRIGDAEPAVGIAEPVPLRREPRQLREVVPVADRRERGVHRVGDGRCRRDLPHRALPSQVDDEAATVPLARFGGGIDRVGVDLHDHDADARKQPTIALAQHGGARLDPAL